MMAIFSIFAKPLGWVMSLLYGWVGSYLLTIFLFTFLVRLALFPVSLKSQKTQADRARLAPRLEKLQKKYGKDQQKLMEKQQELYQKEGVKMTAGCLPSILQMLVLFSVIAVIYKPLTYLQNVPADAINSSITILTEEKNEDGTPLVNAQQAKSEYYKELTLLRFAEDYPAEIKGALQQAGVTDVDGMYGEIVKTKSEFSFFGVSLLDTPWTGSFTGINWLWLVAILSGLTALGTSFVSMHFMKATQPEQQPGQGCMNNSMLYMMPLMSLFISFSVPAGVGLYWVFSNLLAMVQTVVLNSIYNPAKIRAQAYVEYEDRRRRKKEDKQRLAQARAKEEAALKAEKEQENKAKKEKTKTEAPASTDDTSAEKEN